MILVSSLELVISSVSNACGPHVLCGIVCEARKAQRRHLHQDSEAFPESAAGPVARWLPGIQWESPQQPRHLEVAEYSTWVQAAKKVEDHKAFYTPFFGGRPATNLRWEISEIIL